MGLLSPWFALTALAVGVPIFLHLFQKRETSRVSFPALRYLERMERELAREIRLKQLLLLAARVLAVALLALVGARPIWSGAGSSHPPTAVVVVLDNSLSSGVVRGEERVLDELKRVAGRGLEGAGADDVVWVLRAGEPWRPVLPGTPAEALEAIRASEPTAARGDLSAALRRAAELLSGAQLPAREIHLVSDLQRSAFGDSSGIPQGPHPVLVWMPGTPPPPNRSLIEATVGGGLAPVLGQVSEIAVRVEGPADVDAPIGVRIREGDRIRAATSLTPGASAVLPLPAHGPGWVLGTAESDPDALSADDRRFFAFRSRPAPGVATTGDPGLFVSEALAVLEAAERMSTASLRDAVLTVAASGQAIEESTGDQSVLVIPPSDATLLPALNGRLQTAGVPWRYAARIASGGAPVEGPGPLPPGLDGVRAERWLDLIRSGPEPAGSSRVLAEVGGSPWIVETATADGTRVLLIGSPLDESSSSLPVSAGLVRFLDWVASEWAGAGGATLDLHAGEPIPAPSAADRVTTPTGATVEIDGTRTVAPTGSAGHYQFLAGDSLLAVVAVNPHPAESRLERIAPEEVASLIGPSSMVLSDEEAWTDTVFLTRRGAEIWRPLLVLVALLLAAESVLAAAGLQGRRPDEFPRTQPTPHGSS